MEEGVEYESTPCYCTLCQMQGHKIEKCYKIGVENSKLKEPEVRQPTKGGKARMKQWKPKQQPQVEKEAEVIIEVHDNEVQVPENPAAGKLIMEDGSHTTPMATRIPGEIQNYYANSKPSVASLSGRGKKRLPMFPTKTSTIHNS